jgi:hypothetical protein
VPRYESLLVSFFPSFAVILSLVSLAVPLLSSWIVPLVRLIESIKELP